MIKELCVVFSILVSVGSISTSFNLLPANRFVCRFAPLFQSSSLLNDSTQIHLFMTNVSYWEGQFQTPSVGYDMKTGLTFDGHGINYHTGGIADPLHYWTAPSKESLHLMILALALNGNPYAQIFVSPNDPTQYKTKAIEILTNKIKSFQQWNLSYPGYGGYLPWIYITAQGVTPADGWLGRVPSLDNGEFIWALYGLIAVLENQNLNDLAQQYLLYFQMLANNAYIIFYDGGGRVRAETKILNVSALPFPENYVNNVPNYYLDDPYEGELFCFFLDLFGNWVDPNEKELVWELKRKNLQSIDYVTPQGPITVQKGFWFSSHEQWKYLELPYLEVPINRRIFINGERARTWNSYLKKIPGLYASVSNVTTGGPVSQYISAVGIPEIAFQEIITDKLITPYGSFPVMLANLTVGLVWYHNMLLGSKMQGPYGSTESINISGQNISPVLTWDSKITSYVAMLGGISSIVHSKLVSDKAYDRFYTVVDREWNRAFPIVKGEQLEFKLPTFPVPSPLDDFTLCLDN